MEDPIPLIAIVFAFNGIAADKCFLLHVFCFTIIYMYLQSYIRHAEFVLYNEILMY